MGSPLRVSLWVDGRRARTVVEYSGSARIRLNRLVLEVRFDQGGVDIDVRGIGFDSETLRVLADGLKGLASVFREKRRGERGEGYRLTLRLYGLKLLVKRV